ncbi:translation initiation factor IF-2 N-terminal domain-containing protein [Amycolatopsis sp. FDAARGOS 1241]|uniref:translation initiation factor IF-2 N-terminal domain-containing protein n=1 Tax=Amycolatopsis sp. FDAARGOS 1241 TaxID=2778070 RepID=UPI00194DC8D8|nr:translation initiation factor IF-2 N-terminal domain-containing protein [Amycolatopsis sp. FDAARGOS 1241]QRP48325.1 translation initiation factor IF-2 N-terminal domain-containing protein [Amycolatopsis sp. FDAARGOS 1241]
MSNADTPADQTGGNTAASVASQLGELPPRIRVHALAKLLGQSSRDLLAKLAELGESPRSAQSSVTREVAFRVAEALAEPADEAGAETVEAAETSETFEASPAAESAEAASPQPEPAAAASAAQAQAEPAAPAAEPEERTPARRRVRRSVAPAIPAAEAPAAETEPEPQSAQAKRPVHVPVFAAPSPVFLPPEPEPAAERPARPRPEAVFGVGSEPVKAEQAEEEQVEDTTADEADDRSDEDGEGPGGRRRRRRGRRGRGRGKGGDEGADTDEEPGEDQGRKREDDRDRDKDEDDKDKQADTEAGERAEGESDESSADGDADSEVDGEGGSRRRRRRRRRKGGDDDTADAAGGDDPPNTVTHVRQGKAEQAERPARDEVRSVRGSTRLEAKRQRRRDGREAGRRRAPILSEAEFLARRESVERTMVVAEKGDNTQIGVLEDGVLVEHFVTSAGSGSIVGNVYLGRVQNVLPSMEAAFIDIGRGRNAVLYAGEVDWDAAGLEGKARKIEQALSTGDSVLVQVTKDPVGHKGARLTTQISLPGRFLVYVPAGGATGISRKLPENERRRLKDILKRIVPEDAGVIIRTASEGISEEELDRDVRRLKAQWDVIKEKADAGSARKGGAPTMLYEEPDLLVKVVRDLFTEDFAKLEVQGGKAWETIRSYVEHVAPDLTDRLKRYTGTGDVFADHRVDEQIMKALDRKVWLPSGGYLVIDRTEAMTVIDVNTGKFTGSGGNLEETVTRNNLESAEEIVRQLRLRDIGGIIVIDFIDMVLESNRELVLRRLTECLGRDRTRHQVAEVTSLGLVQMTRKKIGTGLLEAFSTPCEHCKGRGVIVSTELQRNGGGNGHNGHNHAAGADSKGSRRSRGRGGKTEEQHTEHPKADQPAGPTPEQRESAVSAVQAMVNASKAASVKTDHEPAEAPEAAGQPAPGGEATAGGEVHAATAGGEAGQAAEDTTGDQRKSRREARAARQAAAAAEAPAERAADVQAGSEAKAEAAEVRSDEAQPAAESETAASEVQPEPAGAAEADESAEAAQEAESEANVPVPATRPTRRRPRRAASRPAGPPVHATEQS